MRPWKISLIAVPIVIVALGGLAYLWRGEIAVAVMKRQAERILASDPIAELPDGLHVGLCGAGSPFPDPTRAEPCVAVVAGRRLFVIDTGEGGAKNLQLMGLPPASVEAVLLTHFHSDHINGLGALFLQHWVAGSNSAPLPVYGPPGVESVVAGFNEAYNTSGPKFGLVPANCVMPGLGPGTHDFPMYKQRRGWPGQARP